MMMMTKVLVGAHSLCHQGSDSEQKTRPAFNIYQYFKIAQYIIYYYYVLYKICELLQEEKFLKFFPMLKDPLKRTEQDEVWKKICHDLKWEYIPTH